MKKTLCLILAGLLLILSGCATSQKNEPYTINRTGITKITGTSQMSRPVKNIVIPSEKTEELLNQLDALHLIPTGEKNDLKGWQYFFDIEYGNGTTIRITLISESLVEIDDYIYKTTLYNSNDFLKFFD